MKKVLIIIFAVLIAIAAAFLVFLSYMGAFDKIEIQEKSMGPFTYAYIEHIGPYHLIGEPMMKLDEEMRAAGFNPVDGISIYYDDPAKVPAEELRSEVGGIIPETELDMVEENQDKFSFNTLPAQNYLVAEFPIRNTLSYMLGPIMVYPAFTKYLQEQQIEIPDKGIEFYDMTNNKIYFMMEKPETTDESVETEVESTVTITETETDTLLTENDDQTPIRLGYDRYGDKVILSSGQIADFDLLQETVLEELNSTLSYLSFPYSDNNPDLIYTGTLETRYENQTAINRLISYNLVDNTWQEIYMEEAESSEGTWASVIDSLALQGNKLIVVKSIPDYSPGICFNIWLAKTPAMSLHYLDLNNPEEGLKPYTVPEWKVAEEQILFEQCEAEYS